TRNIVARADDSGVMFLTNGDGPPGTTGRMFRSDDYGATWRDCPLPTVPNSTVWIVATHPSEPMLLYACSALGHLWRSEDGGDTWAKLRREFGELRALILRPLE